MMSNKLSFGSVVLTEHPVDDSATRYRDEIREQAQLVESLEFDSLWVGEHHFTDRPYFDNFQILSYLSNVTSSVDLGTSICIAPLHNPVVLAERIANVDVLSDGRFIFGVAVGYREKEFEILDVDRTKRGARLDESLDLLQSLWNENDITYEGEQFQFENVSINPKPAQEGGPSIWIGGTAPKSVRRAAQKGDAWFVDPRISKPKLKKPTIYYDEQLDTAGRTPECRPIWREVFVGETKEEAIETARPYLMEKYGSYLEWGADDAVGDDTVDSKFAELTKGRFLLGSPEDVIEEIERYREAFDMDYLVIRTRWPGMPVEIARASLQRFANKVVPHFR